MVEQGKQTELIEFLFFLICYRIGAEDIDNHEYKEAQTKACSLSQSTRKGTGWQDRTFRK